MSAQKDCEFLVKRARELVPEDPCAAKAWLITARTLYPADFTIQVRSMQQSNVNVCVPNLTTNPLIIYYTARLMFMHVLLICLNIFPQYEMYIIERNAERTASAGRLLYDM